MKKERRFVTALYEGELKGSDLYKIQIKDVIIIDSKRVKFILEKDEKEYIWEIIFKHDIQLD